MITNKHEAKKMTKHISYDCKCKFNSTICNVIWIKNEIMKHVNVSVKIIEHGIEVIIGILAHVFASIASI